MKYCNMYTNGIIITAVTVDYGVTMVGEVFVDGVMIELLDGSFFYFLFMLCFISIFFLVSFF